MNYRKTISERYLVGRGIEFGALHNPLEIDRSQAEVFYADKYSRSKLVDNFKELEAVAEDIVETDTLLDLNQLEYSSLDDNDFDFFIANHVIEHLVNPLSFLNNLNSIMKTGSYLYLAVPDKEYTFDRHRKLHDWEHFHEEYQQKITRLSKEHLEDFLFNKMSAKPNLLEKTSLSNYWYQRAKSWRLSPQQYYQQARFHLKRSIHVHVWNQDSFDRFIALAIENLGLDLEIKATVKSADSGYEMIYILQKIEPRTLL